MAEQIDRLSAPPDTQVNSGGDGLRLWWRIVDMRIGIIPLPLYPVILALTVAFVRLGKVTADLTMMIPVIALGAYTCSELGKRIPVLRSIGAPAILSVFVPSYMVYAHLLPQPLVEAVDNFYKQSNFLYLFISCIIVGSILGMNRQVLIKGFLKIFAPLAAGSLAALIVGPAVGALLGLGWRHTLFFIVIPIMAGGIGEGALPLSLGYSTILGQAQTEIFPQVLSSVILGNFAALLFSGGLNYLGRIKPHLTGNGRLQPLEHDDVLGDIEHAEEERASGTAVTAATIGAAGVTAVTLYLIGIFVQDVWGFPAPVLLLVAAVALKLLRAVSARLREGASIVYRFFADCVTYPLIFAIGVALTPWDQLVAALQPEILIVILISVATIVGAGFIVGGLVKLYPIDAAIVNACHSGQGGTGDVMILSAANRMELMPFAQIATRIGGAITVTLALLALARSA